VYGIDLKAELERTGHPYSALLEMKMPEFEQFVQSTIRPMIDQLGVKLGQVVVAGDTYLETNGQLAGTDASMARVAAKLYGKENTTVLQVSTTQGEPGPRQLFETNVDERGHANVTTPSVDPSGRNGDLAPKVLVKRQAEMGQIARDAYNAQLPLSESEVDAMRNRGSVSQGPKLPESVSFAGVDEQGAVQFTPKQLAAMQEAAQGDGQVWMSSYSSTGGGHTERLLGPVADAVKPGDVVVLYLPLPWESDTGGAAGTLKKYLGELHDKGAVTIIAQSDRTITGLYDKPTGKSDNPRILDNFVNSLNPPKAIDKDILDNRNVPTFAADALVGKVVEAVGDKNKIKVVSDMGINLTNAAEKAGIPFRLEIGNHQGNLIVPSLNAQGDRRWDGFLQLATAGSQTAIGSVSYSNKINPLPTMKATLDSADFNASMTPAAAQQLAIKTLYEKGVRLPLNEAGENDTPGVLMAPGAKLSDLDSVVALYVNAYTPQVVRHIKEQLNRGNSDYQNTLFLVAGRKAMRNPDTDPNALHLAYVHGDMLMNAGYGTTSEADYLKQVAGHQGQFVIMPVQRQHEQEQNAVVMKERLGDDVQIAEDPDQLIRTLDELMPNRTTTQSLEDRANDPSGPPESKTMQRFLDALGDDSTMRKSLAELAAGRRTMTLEEDRLNTLSANPYALSDGLTQRRLLYLAWPALKATLKGEPSFTSQVSRDLPPMQFDNLQELANVLEDDSALEQTLGLEELGTRQSRDVRRYLQDAFHDLLNTPNPVERKLKARDYMADLGERFNLGY
jgi:hypothetical protein